MIEQVILFYWLKEHNPAVYFAVYIFGAISCNTGSCITHPSLLLQSLLEILFLFLISIPWSVWIEESQIKTYFGTGNFLDVLDNIYLYFLTPNHVSGWCHWGREFCGLCNNTSPKWWQLLKLTLFAQLWEYQHLWEIPILVLIYAWHLMCLTFWLFYTYLISSSSRDNDNILSICEV